MSTKNGKTRIAAIADLHVQKSVAEAPFRELFAEVSNQADILALCGDLTNSGLPEEAESLVKNLKACKIPVVAVLGNHDYHSGRVEEVKKVLAEGKLALLDGQGCEVKGVGFAGTKGFGGGFGERMLSSFGEEAIKGFVAEAVDESVKLESGLGSLTSHYKIVLLHYSPISQTVEGSRSRSIRSWVARGWRTRSIASRWRLCFTDTRIGGRSAGRPQRALLCITAAWRCCEAKILKGLGWWWRFRIDKLTRSRVGAA